MIEEFGKRMMLRESCVQRKYRIRRTQSRRKTRGGGGGNYYSFSLTVHTGSGIIIITEKTLGLLMFINFHEVCYIIIKR